MEIDSQYLPEPYIQTIVLNDGMVVNGSGSTDSDLVNLWLWLSNLSSFSDLYEIFDDPNKTAKIIINSSPFITKTYYGYTFLTNIKRTPDGKFSVCLKKPIT